MTLKFSQSSKPILVQAYIIWIYSEMPYPLNN